MKIKKALFINESELTDSQIDIYAGLSGDCEAPFIISVKDFKECLDNTIELNDGREVMDCQGRHFKMNYDNDIEYMTKVIVNIEDCEIIVVFKNNWVTDI